MNYKSNETALKPLTEALEEKRQVYLDLRQTAKKFYWLPLGLLILFVLISLLYDTPLLLCLLFCFSLTLFIKFNKVDVYIEEYNETYKETFIKPFVPVFYPNLTYLPGKFSTSNNIQASFLYDSISKDARLNCEDGFRGKTAQGLSFTLMEIHYQVDNYGKSKTKREIFISIELPNKGYRPVVVAPGARMQYILERYNEKRISEAGLEVEEPILKQEGFERYFEDKYAVYSQKKEDVATLLSPSFLAVIQKLGRQCIGNIRFSFVKDVLHIALPSQQNFFEADLQKTVLTNTVGQELFNELSTCLSIVEELESAVNQLKLPSKERIPLPKELDLSNQNWEDSAYDHFIDN